MVTTDQSVAVRLSFKVFLSAVSLFAFLMSPLTAVAEAPAIYGAFAKSAAIHAERTAVVEEVDYQPLGPIFVQQPEGQSQESELQAETVPKEFTQKLYTCRYDAISLVKGVFGGDCPSHSPKPFSERFKYPASYLSHMNIHSSNHVGIRGDEIIFCMKTPLYGGNRYSKSRPIPEFCEDEILQLQMDMPERLSNQTAIQVNWSDSTNSVPFYCPDSFRTYEPVEEETEYCLSQVCRPSYAIQSNGKGQPHGRLYVDGNKWILNLMLHERIGHRLLYMRVFSCPSLEPPHCQIYCEPDKCCCCNRMNTLDIKIVKIERNTFHPPPIPIGNELFNVTIEKNSDYDDIWVTDTQTNKTVVNIGGNLEPQLHTVALPLGIFQVNGTIESTCGARGLISPITLLPLNATLKPLEFVDFALRKLSWDVTSDIPVTGYELLVQTGASMRYNATQKEIIFDIGGDEFNTPVPVEQTFLFSVQYSGIDEEKHPRQPLTINLEGFMPTDTVVSYNNTHTELRWNNPVSHPDNLEAYQLHVDRTSRTLERMFDIVPNQGGSQRFVYSHTHPYPSGETLKLRLGAVYKKHKSHLFWWGPEASLSVDISVVPSSSTTPTSNVLPTTTSNVLPTTTITPTVSSKNSNLGVIAGSAMAGAVVLTAAGVGMTVAIYFCTRKLKNSSHRLNNPVSDDVLDSVSAGPPHPTQWVTKDVDD